MSANQIQVQNKLTQAVDGYQGLDPPDARHLVFPVECSASFSSLSVTNRDGTRRYSESTGFLPRFGRTESLSVVGSESSVVASRDCFDPTVQAVAIKIPRSGRPRRTRVFTFYNKHQSLWYIGWASKKTDKSRSCMPIEPGKCLVGVGAKYFTRRKYAHEYGTPDADERCLSLSDERYRSLDLVIETCEEMSAVVQALCAILDQ